MNFYLDTGLVGSILAGMNDITGSLFLTLLCMTILLMAICLAFSIPPELTAIIMLPLCIAIMAMNVQEFLSVLGIIAIYLGIFLGKHFFGN